MKGLTFSNELISRDEGFTAISRASCIRLKHKLSEAQLHEIVSNAVHRKRICL